MKSSFPAYDKAKSPWIDTFATVALFAGVIGLAMSPALTRADGRFMDYETDRSRIVEANDECRIHGEIGGNVTQQECVDAYYCTAWGIDCEGGLRQVEPAFTGGAPFGNSECDGEGCATVLNQ